MNWNVLKAYLKSRLISIPVALVILALIYYFAKDKSYLTLLVPLWLIDWIPGYFRYINRQSYLADLAKNGLTEKEVIDSAFLDEWKEKQEKGIFKYCLVDGGIILGAILSLIIAFIAFFFLPNNGQRIFSSGPGDIFAFIGYTYLIGIILGIMINRVVWHFNQKKFLRLTNLQH